MVIRKYVHRLHHQPGLRRIAGTATARGGIIQCLDILLPQIDVRAPYSAIICHQPVDLSFHIRCLGPHAPAAGVQLHLLAELSEELVGAVVVGLEVRVQLICLVNGIDGLLDLP